MAIVLCLQATNLLTALELAEKLAIVLCLQATEFLTALELAEKLR